MRLQQLLIFFWVMAAVILLAFVYFSQNPLSETKITEKSSKEAAKGEKAQLKAGCGDGICGLSEGCSGCPADCGCDKGDYCSAASGVCYQSEKCGDGNCTSSEKSSGACCNDCGCGEGSVCNLYINACQDSFSLSDANMARLRRRLPEYSLASVADGYYYSMPAKILTFDCTKSDNAPCGYYLTVLENGSVADESMVIFTTGGQ